MWRLGAHRKTSYPTRQMSWLLFSVHTPTLSQHTCRMHSVEAKVQHNECTATEQISCRKDINIDRTPTATIDCLPHQIVTKIFVYTLTFLFWQIRKLNLRDVMTLRPFRPLYKVLYTGLFMNHTAYLLHFNSPRRKCQEIGHLVGVHFLFYWLGNFFWLLLLWFCLDFLIALQVQPVLPICSHVWDHPRKLGRPTGVMVSSFCVLMQWKGEGC